MAWSLRNLAEFLNPTPTGDITPGAGSVALTGQTPDVLNPVSITPNAGSVAITGNAATVTTGDITPGTGSLTLTGKTPTVSSSNEVNITPGTAIGVSPTSATLVWFSGTETGNANEFTNGVSNGGGGTPTVQTITKRTGSYALLTPHDGTARARVTNLAATTFLRAYFRPTGNPTTTVPIVGVGSSVGTPKFFIFLNSDGTVGWAFGFSPTTPTTSGPNSAVVNNWNLLEVKFVRDASVGGVEVYLNGVLQFTALATDTTSGTSASAMSYIFGNDVNQPGTNQSGIDIYWDDLAVATGSYIGSGQCLAFQGKSGTPTYDAWSKTGAADAFGCWSQTPFDAAKFCSDNVVADRQTMFVDDAAIASAIPSGAINGAMVVCVAKIVSTGTFKITRRLNGVDTDSATKALSTTDTFEPNPVNGDSMDVFKPMLADLTGGTLEIGAVANSTNTATVEDMWLLVDYKPDTGSSMNVVGQQSVVSSSSNPNITPNTGSLSITGAQPRLAIIGDLVVIWNDLSPLSAILPILWDVVSPGPVGQLPVQWNVVETIVPLQVTWRVIPNLRPTFDATIQKPVATIVETP